ncbi:MAG: precorrin-8X methylmutase [Chloroflexota bacterium]|nr:precorrin-8X methylmutase [Chloroflexota bacterium]
MNLDPITAESFAIVEAELAALGIQLPPDQHPLMRRAIHSTADFELAHTLRFHPQAIERGVATLRAGAAVVSDVRMVAVGIDRLRLHALGGRVLCQVAEQATADEARTTGATRSAAGVRLALREAREGAIVVIGNAPTALREVLRQVDAGTSRPALIIGVPVGFVDAAESKAALMDRNSVPWIAVAGRKGGSPVAAALINALLHLAVPAVEE